jgi:hypothetical protein
MDNFSPSGDWKIRRRFMFGVSLFSMWAIAYVLMRGSDTRSAETAVEMAFLCLTGIVSSYVFGATWENIHRMKNNPPPPAAKSLLDKTKLEASDAGRSD